MKTSREKALMVEAALFAAGRPLTVEEISEITGLDREEVEAAIPEISRSLTERPYHLEDRPDGLFLTLRPEYLEIADRAAARPELSRAELRTLAVISARGPMKLSELAELRGSSAYSHVKKLRRKGLVYVRREGRGKIVGVTRDFWRFFEVPAGEVINEEVGKVIGSDGEGGEGIKGTEG